MVLRCRIAVALAGALGLGLACASPGPDPAVSPREAPSPKRSHPVSPPSTGSSTGKSTGAKTASAGGAPVESPVSRVRQLTFEGRRSGEGYFGPQGRRLVFQSEREPGNPFYQIYLMDLETGDVERVSQGKGKATCAWIHPGGGRVLFSATHLDPAAARKQADELAFRESGGERRYEWDYDPNYEIFSKELERGRMQRLTNAQGYDAEASWSPDGRQIVFASNRKAFERKLTPEEGERLERDPSQFIDLYIMDANGRNVRRLTDSPGYDGGPFFSPDGQRVVWRRFSENGALAEIYTIRTDGTDERKLTDLGAMSWAPFYHPSGDYIVFTTNLHGMDDFELYMVDARGEAAPVRVTNREGFDGLPAFAPDGEQVVFTSTRSGGSSQLFLADWDDARARSLLGLPSVQAASVPPLLPLPEGTSPEIDPSDLRAYVDALASEAAAGRLTGTAGERIATSYVARVFRSLGLEPAGDRGSYFQEFGFTAGVDLGDDNLLELEGSGPTPALFEIDRDWRPFAFSRTGPVEPSEVTFAGYGLVAPANGEQPEIDDYAHLDVRDKWVLVFRFVPEGLPKEHRQHLHHYSTIRYKAMIARDLGARGLMVVSGPRSKVRKELPELSFDASLQGSSVAAVGITDETAEALLAPSGRKLAELQEALDREGHVQGFALPDVRLRARIDLRQQRRTGRNVIARLAASGSADAPAILVGAHIDHLGRGEGSSSLARENERGRLHLGADDNASGVAAMLEVAQWLVHRRAIGLFAPRRDVVFAAWSGEELGLLGSSHYVEELIAPKAPDAELTDRVAAYLNLDMVGRLDGELSVFGVGSSPIWPREIERRNVPVGLSISAREDSFLPTDAAAFYTAGVPTLSAFTGAHEDYHTPRDVPDRLDYAGMRDIARLIAGLAASLATSEQAPRYTEAPPSPTRMARAGLRVYLGTIPDYADGDVSGVRLAGVVKGGPAEAAGLRARDVIVEVAGRQIDNIYDYTYSLQDLEVGESADLVVLRETERIELRIVPVSRQ